MSQRIVFLDRASLPPHINLRRPAFEHVWQEYPHSAPDQVVERLQGAQIALVNKVPLGEAQLAQLPTLRLIAEAATGTDNLDLDACRRRGIAVYNIQGYAIHAVAEHTLALMLALARNLMAYRQDLAAGAWQTSSQFCYLGPRIHDLAGKRLGLIGRGSLGQAVGRLGEALGMEVVYAGRKGDAAPGAGRLPFETLLRTADVVSLHCPLTADTRGLIGAAELAMLKPSALLINTARGGLVDEAALLTALQAGRLAGAAADVASREPPAADHPLMQASQQHNFILTPHVAWASDEAMQRLADQLIENLEHFVAGNGLRRLV